MNTKRLLTGTIIAGLIAVGACGDEGNKGKAQENKQQTEESKQAQNVPIPVVQNTVKAVEVEQKQAQNVANEMTNNNNMEGASIMGTISFKGDDPKKKQIDMGADATCKGMHQGPVYSEEVMVDTQKDGGAKTLRNVMVYVKKGLPADKKYETPKEPVVINQEGCTYKPHVFGIMVNQTLIIKNSDQVDHNIKSTPQKNKSFNEGQVKGSPDKEHKFTMEEMPVKLECNIHGWMNAFCGVFKHPFFSVSGEDGKFELKGLPPGEYEIEAWHEKLGKKMATVKVGEKESKTQDFTFEGK